MEEWKIKDFKNWEIEKIGKKNLFELITFELITNIRIGQWDASKPFTQSIFKSWQILLSLVKTEPIDLREWVKCLQTSYLLDIFMSL